MENYEKHPGKCDRNSFVRFCVIAIVILVLLQLFYSNDIYEKTTRMVQILNFQRYQHIRNTLETTELRNNIQNDNGTERQYNFTLCNNKTCNISSIDLNTSSNLPLCPKTPPKLVGPLATYSDSPSYEELEKLYPEVSSGGRYKPPDCISRHKVAIVLPYRNRDIHLRTFLKNIHPFLERQQLDYGIYVVEQAEGSKFNRALLMNIGYAEAIKIYDYQCFAFHDVDLIPQDDRNIYNCPSQPRHLTAAIDKYGYRLPYNSIFGGAVMLTRKQFQKVNGFSNKFFGWGGEDDDMWNRVKRKGYSVIRYPMNIARYRMIKHSRDKGNEPNPQRMSLLNKGAKRYATDGINGLKYKVLKLEYHKLYTRILVSIDEKEIMKS